MYVAFIFILLLHLSPSLPLSFLRSLSLHPPSPSFPPSPTSPTLPSPPPPTPLTCAIFIHLNHPIVHFCHSLHLNVVTIALVGSLSVNVLLEVLCYIL